MELLKKIQPFVFTSYDEELSGSDSFLKWWSQIESSQHWHFAIFYALCAAYALISTVALVQLVRIQLRVPEYGWTTQKVFHMMNFAVNGIRAVQFGLYRIVFHIKPKAFDIIILDLPGLLFFSTYTLLVLFWAEIYHQARSLPIDKLRPAYFIINSFIYLIQVCIWTYMRISRSATAVELARLFFAVMSLCAALGFMVYGGRLFIMLRRFPIESRGRQKKLHEVGFVTGICCTCFLIRCLMATVSAFDEGADYDVLNHPIVDLIYYTTVEILPSALVLFILRKLPPKRVSDQYHPISLLGTIMLPGRLASQQTAVIVQVGFVTGICCTCFLIRCLMATVSAFDEGADYDVLISSRNCPHNVCLINITP